MNVHVLRTYIVVSDGMKTKPRTKPGHKWEWLEEQIYKTSEHPNFMMPVQYMFIMHSCFQIIIVFFALYIKPLQIL